MTIYKHIVGWASAVLVVGPTSPTTAAATSSPARPGWAPRGCRIQASATATATAARTGSTAAFSIAAHAPASTVVGVQIKSAILLYRSKYQQQASSSSK